MPNKLLGNMNLSVHRQDIQQLRAVAVLAVIVNHLEASWLPGGYLGVDMFFVVSGFVITNSMMLSKAKATSRIQIFAYFWIRRVFRLWPMLFTTVLLTSAFILFTELGPPDTLLTGIASLVGVTNLRLILGRLDYFALDTGTDWFMHTWSLAVEEQVYLILSALFFVFAGVHIKLFGRSFRVVTAVISLLVTASLLFSFAPFTIELVRFYSPHTRLYQIGAGALLALISTNNTRGNSSRLNHGLVFIGLAGLFVQFTTTVVDGAAASLAVTLLTTLVLASAVSLQHSRGFVPIRWIGAIGDRSYALYLLHWPVQLFASSLINNEVVRAIFSLCLTFTLGIASYRFIENPTRHMWQGLRARFAIGLALSALVVTVALTAAGYEHANRKNAMKTPVVLSETCSQENSSAWLIGDSHLGAIQHEIATIFHGNCRVYGDLGFNVLFGTEVVGSLPSGQIKRGFKLLDIEKLKIEIRINRPNLIIVTHFLTGIASDSKTSSRSANWITIEWKNSDGAKISRSSFIRQFGENLTDLAVAMSDYGGLLVVTSPPPEFDWLSEPNDAVSDLNYEVLCAESFPSTTHQRVRPQCDIWRKEAVISRKIHEDRIGEIHNLLNKIEKTSGNFIHLALDESFCNEFECRNFKDGFPAYIDDDHLNALGASLIAEQFKEIFDRLQQD